MKLGVAQACPFVNDNDYDDDPRYASRPLILTPPSSEVIPIHWEGPGDSSNLLGEGSSPVSLV